ncbi:MAG: excinuclease ABC subunit A, partial [Planctomycetota bacterium]
DRLIDFGPGSGRLGGTITAEGTPKQVARKKSSITGRYLAGSDEIKVPTERRRSDGKALALKGVQHHNLRNVDLTLPLGSLVCITGVSGSGKSSLIEGTLAPAVARALGQSGNTPGPFRSLTGTEYLSKIIAVDQAPLGATPASNPATYTGVFDLIRELYCRLPAAKARGYKPARFSFNRPGGRCEVCEGMGQKKIEMHFLPDVWVECDACGGKRYTEETLAVTYKDKSIADVLEMSIGEAYDLFANVPKIRAVLGVLKAIGLDYLSLGQSAPTLSGGEAQRVKLAAELARPDAGQTLYLLDEPTTGLHLADIAKLLQVLNGLVERGNTVCVIEHNLDVIKTADWLIDLGPEAGSGGGRIVADGSPEDVVRDAAEISHTARLLKPVLEASGKADRAAFRVEEEAKKRDGDTTLTQFGRDEKAPWESDGVRWHTRDRLAHNGQPAKWEGALLSHVVDALSDSDDFAEPNWSERSVVEVTAAGKPTGWFLHAKTAQEWFCSLTFRVAKGAFNEGTLRKRFPWAPADELDLPVYGPDARVRVRDTSLRSATGAGWQEVTFKAHWEREVNTPEFAAFLKEAKASYLSVALPDEDGQTELAPWERLGKDWHLSPQGFVGRRPKWKPIVLSALSETMEEAVPDAEANWTAKTVVAFNRPGADGPFAELHTKRPAGLDLTIPIEPGAVALGRIADLGAEREIARHRGGEAVKLRIKTIRQATAPALKTLLSELAGDG